MVITRSSFLGQFREESTAIPDVGIDGLLKNKKLDKLINGPVYWIDSADGHPCIGKEPFFL